MKKTVLMAVASLLMMTTACDKKQDLPEPEPQKQEINVVSKFVYDGMLRDYKWADDMSSKKPTVSDNDPAKYFYSLLHKSDTEHGWSWITDDVDELLAEFAGESKTFGYNLQFFTIKESADKYKILAIVKYVFPNTPADKAGIKRLDIIGEVNGKNITADSDGYIDNAILDEMLYGGTPAKLSIYNFDDEGLIKKTKDVDVTPIVVKTNPVLVDSVYTIGDKKVGYLFYTSYLYPFNSKLFDAFSKFKQAGVSDLVLDLRYNGGGSVSSALYLASMIAPRDVVEAKSPFIVMDYNQGWNNAFDKWYNEASAADKYRYDRKNYLGGYSTENGESDPLTANLDLKRVYIIATGNSYSASELTTFALGSYMDVVHIGAKTGGKYTASWTIHAYDNDKGNAVYDSKDLSSEEKSILKNWAMQPIIAIYSNKDSKSFLNPGYLEPDYKVSEGGYGDREHTGGTDFASWKPLGDTSDPYLAKALYLITGDAKFNISASTRSSSAVSGKVLIDRNETPSPLRIDNRQIPTEKMQELLRK